MTQQQMRQRFIWATTLGLLGTMGFAALASEEATSTSTFLTVAEKFGIFAAMSLGLTVCAVYGLWRIVNYVITTMQTVIDDNTHAKLRFANLMKKRPCISDSDVDQIIVADEGEIDPDSDNGIAKRVHERRQRRIEKKTVL